MNKRYSKWTYILLPTITFLLGIFIGLKYLDFQSHLTGINTVPISNQKEVLEDKLNKFIKDLDKKNSKEYETTNSESDKSYTIPSKNEIKISMLWDVWDVVKDKFFVEDIISPEKVLYGAISGMIDALDDKHTVFLDPIEAESFEVEVSGEVEGIGAEITYRKKNIQIVSVIKNSPAFKSGLKADDIILKIDGVSTKDYTFFEAISHIRGKKGSKVVLTIFREELDEALEVEITRDVVDVENVTWEKRGDYVWLVINRFTHDVESELKKVSTDIIAEDPKAIILDMRDNGGGYMDQAIEVVDSFISDGVIVSRKFADGKTDTFEAHKDTLFAGYPLVVLINSESASASEIVAGAIQDYGAGKIIGETSYGKGSVQQTFDFNGATLKLTVAKWYTPDGRNIDGEGIVPDIEVDIPEEDFDEDVDYILEDAIRFLDKSL